MASVQDNALPFRVFLGSIGFALAFFGVEHFNVEHITKRDVVWAIWLLVPALVIEVVAFKWPGIREAAANLPRLRIVWVPRTPSIDLVEDATQRIKKKQIRQHTADLVERQLSPSHEAADKALRAIVGQLPPSRLRDDLVHAYEIIIADEGAQLGALSVMANRSLQDAAEETKPTIAMLTDTLSRTTAHHLRFCRLVDTVRLQPAVLLHPPPEIGAWKDALERLKDHLRLTAEMDGFIEVTRLRSELHPSIIPANAPKVVAARYGRENAQRPSAEGLFIENIGGPARNVVMRSFNLGLRIVSFSGPEITQLKREDGARFREVDVEWPKNFHQMDLFDPFRQWQQEQGDTSLETVGLITYEDFDGNRYETHYRIGIDVLNQDGGMVVGFLEQRRR